MARRLYLPLTIALTLLLNAASAETPPQTEKEKFSYTLGVQLARNILSQPVEVDREAFLQGVDDALRREDLKLSQQEMLRVLTAYSRKQKAQQEEAAETNQQETRVFLSENSRKEGIIVLSSGLQYQIIRKGDGRQPAEDDNVRVHYEGTLINGTVFDSSYRRGSPVDLNLDQVIEGWRIALPLMSVGAKWKLFIPPELAYGVEGAGPRIGPNTTLIFVVELLGVN